MSNSLSVKKLPVMKLLCWVAPVLVVGVIVSLCVAKTGGNGQKENKSFLNKSEIQSADVPKMEEAPMTNSVCDSSANSKEPQCQKNEVDIFSVKIDAFISTFERVDSSDELRKEINTARQYAETWGLSDEQRKKLAEGLKFAETKLDGILVKDISSMAQTGDVEQLNSLLSSYRDEKGIPHTLTEEKITELLQLAKANQWKPYRQMLRDGSTDGIKNAQWQKRIDFWRQNHVKVELNPWAWDDQRRNEDVKGKACRKSWLRLFDEQCDWWKNNCKEAKDALIDVQRRYAITNEYFKSVEEQLGRLQTAITNHDSRVVVDKWTPRKGVTWVSGHAYGRKLPASIRFKIEKQLLTSNEVIVATCKEYEQLEQTLHGQVEELGVQMKNQNQVVKLKNDFYAVATNAVEELNSAVSTYLDDLITGKKDEELMNKLLELIVNQDDVKGRF